MSWLKRGVYAKPDWLKAFQGFSSALIFALWQGMKVSPDKSDPDHRTEGRAMIIIDLSWTMS